MKTARSLLAAVAVLAAILFPFTASAQQHYKAHIWVGARGAYSMSRADFSPSIKQKWNSGSAGALTFRYSEEKIFGLVAEIGWTRRGWAENFDPAPLSYSRSATYVTIPVFTHISFGSARVKGFVNLGPSVSFLAGSSTKSNFDYRNPAATPEFPKNRRTEQFTAEISNKFDYGISAGAGMEFRISPRNAVAVEARYYFGLGNMFPSSKADTFGASRNTNIEVGAAYLFRLK